MRGRFGASCAVTAGAAIAGVAGAAGCVSDDSSGGAPDASLPDVAIDTGGVVITDSSRPDTTTTDAGADTAQPDTGLPDTAPACAPQAIVGFVAPPYVPAAPQNLVCGHPEDDAVGADCYGDASSLAKCNAFPATGLDGGPVDPNCLSCLFTDEHDAGEAGTYGAIVQGVVPVGNVAGCIQLLDFTDAGYDCAVAVQAAWQCAEYACKTACPVTDDPSREAYLACTQAAAAGVCATYTQAAQTCIVAELADGGTNPDMIRQYCVGGPGPGDQLTALAAFFCTS